MTSRYDYRDPGLDPDYCDGLRADDDGLATDDSYAAFPWPPEHRYAVNVRRIPPSCSLCASGRKILNRLGAIELAALDVLVHVIAVMAMGAFVVTVGLLVGLLVKSCGGTP